MADPVFPATLLQYPLRASYRESDPDTALQSPMDAGPPKARRRFTAGERPFQCELVLRTQAEKNSLSAFYVTTTASGSLPFTWAGVDAISGGGTGRYRMVRPPQYTKRGVQGFTAQLTLIRLP